MNSSILHLTICQFVVDMLMICRKSNESNKLLIRRINGNFLNFKIIFRKFVFDFENVESF